MNVSVEHWVAYFLVLLSLNDIVGAMVIVHI